MAAATPKRWGRAALVAAGVLVAPLLAELLVRGVLLVSGEPYGAEATRREIALLVSSVTDPLPELELAEEIPGGENHVLHPYQGFDVEEAVTLVAELQRLDAEAAASGERSFKILVVGGSVAGMLARYGSVHLERVLAGEPRFQDLPIRVENGGRGSYKQPQQLMLVAYLLALGIRPDLVVNIDGFNEVALGYENVELESHPAYPHWPRWAHVAQSGGLSREALRLAARTLDLQDEVRALGRRALDRGYPRSALLGTWCTSRLGSLKADWLAAQRAYLELLSAESAGDAVRGPAYAADRERALDDIAAGWLECSLSIDALCRARGIQYLHFLQPTYHDAGSKPRTAEEEAAAEAPEVYVEAVRLGYPKLRAAGQRLVERGVPFIDASGAFAELADPVYFDMCHFKGLGTRVFAELIARAIAERCTVD